ncbi:hypothetical protein FQA47_017151 [Oryzias melastigma]|uniref:Uncharacterized protein n=1 Tax=Oryzias melastigma TaxID=30732 RepID=A0A834C6M1_ORYME|nr:hypothetical protein FQA47_017151 [Oryzias melastigma]
MAVSRCIWIASFFISIMTSDTGVWTRSVDSQGFLSRGSNAAASDVALRTDAHRERCAKLTVPWLENAQEAPGTLPASLLQLRVRPFSPGPSRGLVFPGKNLFSFIRRVYRCCQDGLNCRDVKGIQGRQRGDSVVEFVLTREILALAVIRAELHLHLSNTQNVDFLPEIQFLSKHNLPTRYSVGSRGDTVELRVDLLFLFQSLQRGGGGAGRGSSLINIRRSMLFSGEDPPGDTHEEAWGDGLASTLPALDLGLILGCSKAGSGVPCGRGSIQLSHTPFMVLYYR